MITYQLSQTKKNIRKGEDGNIDLKLGLHILTNLNTIVFSNLRIIFAHPVTLCFDTLCGGGTFSFSLCYYSRCAKTLYKNANLQKLSVLAPIMSDKWRSS